jgi:ethanolamine transporter EutH
VVQGALSRRLLALVLSSGHERASRPWLVLLLLSGAVRGAFVGVLVPLGLAMGAVEDRSDRFLARGVAGGDVEELLGGSWTFSP